MVLVPLFSVLLFLMRFTCAKNYNEDIIEIHKLLVTMNARIEQLEHEKTEMRSEINSLEHKNEALTTEIRELRDGKTSEPDLSTEPGQTVNNASK